MGRGGGGPLFIRERGVGGLNSEPSPTMVASQLCCLTQLVTGVTASQCATVSLYIMVTSCHRRHNLHVSYNL
jgi:hypothetical protein